MKRLKKRFLMEELSKYTPAIPLLKKVEKVKVKET